MQKLIAEEQMLLSMEHLALGFEFVINREELKSEEIVEFIDKMQKDYQSISQPVDDRKESALRKFLNYKKKWNEYGFPVAFDFKTKIFSGLDNLETIINICTFYIRRISINFDQNALEIFARNISEQGKYPLKPLIYLVSIKYAIKFHLPMVFDYHKLNSTKISQRKVYPYGIAMRSGYIDLIAHDIKDDKDKQFILSRIHCIHSSLYREYNHFLANLRENKNTQFAYTDYMETLEGGFQRIKKTYQLQLFAHSYDHFRHTYNIEHKIKEKKSDNDVTIEFSSVDYRLIQQIVFNYGTYCRLLSPEDELNKYVELLKKQLKHYS